MNRPRPSSRLLLAACSISALAALGAGTCIQDVVPAPTACSLTIVNNCPVIPNGVDGDCGSVVLATAGVKKSDPYSQGCQYKAQKRNGAGTCVPTDPPEFGSFTKQCHRSAGEGCKDH